MASDSMMDEHENMMIEMDEDEEEQEIWNEEAVPMPTIELSDDDEIVEIIDDEQQPNDNYECNRTHSMSKFFDCSQCDTTQQIARLRMQHQSSTSADDDAESDLPAENSSELWLDYCQSKTPLLSVMFKVSQRSLETLIEHQADWLQQITEPNYMHWLISWIYASLAHLHLPLEPNMHNVLRCIAKMYIRLRNGLIPIDTKNAVPLNLLICIISRNFNQLDLCCRSTTF